MVLRDKKDRQYMIYFPSRKDKERWRRLAREAKMPLSRWIYWMVEARIDEVSDGASSPDLVKIQSENRRLRRELEKSESRIRELETELFKYRNQYFATTRGIGEFDPRLLEALRSGGTWGNREILDELGINPSDADAIQIVSKQLELLHDLGLVKNTNMGWRWVG